MTVPSVYPVDLLADLDPTPRPDCVAIYALCDPRDPDAIRYIGKTADPARRLYQHSYRPGPNPHRRNWLRQLKRAGLLPVMRVMAWVPVANWPIHERAYIAAARAHGYRLINVAPGGEGGGPQPGTWHPTDEQRAVLRRKLTGVVRTPEQRARYSMVRKAILATPEGRAAHSTAMLQRGEKFRRRQSDRIRATWSDPERKAQRVEQLRTVFADPTVRATIKAAAIQSWSDPERKAERVAKCRETKRRNRLLASMSLEASLEAQQLRLPFNL